MQYVTMAQVLKQGCCFQVERAERQKGYAKVPGALA
jgi:hypothetical protein